MPDRRQHCRFVPVIPWVGMLRLLSDVTLLEERGQELLVLSQAIALPGEPIALAPIPRATSDQLRGRVLENRPVVQNDSVLHELHIELLDHSNSGSVRWRDIALMWRTVPVRVTNVSNGGCLAETASPVAAGASAELHIAIDQRQYCEVVVVTRSGPSARAAMSELGLQFVWANPVEAASLWDVVSGLGSHQAQP